MTDTQPIYAAVRVKKLMTLAQLNGQSRHAMRLDETSRRRLRRGATAGECIAWSKAGPQDDARDLHAAYKAHKRATGAKERKNAPLGLQVLCVVSPEWIAEAGDVHDPKNPHNVQLFEAAREWAESWAGEGAVANMRLDLDENGAGVVDLLLSPVALSRGKPVISTNKPLEALKRATGERNEFAALQTSWAAHASQRLSERLLRGTRKEITQREHLSPELYGQMEDEKRDWARTRKAVLAEREKIQETADRYASAVRQEADQNARRLTEQAEDHLKAAEELRSNLNRDAEVKSLRGQLATLLGVIDETGAGPNIRAEFEARWRRHPDNLDAELRSPPVKRRYDPGPSM